ncbi:hypothetical protein BV20DRAFT_778461 [Pilatotrama ljubarskyi]|nr:hypothetical protein BV20DRAFT_778461 [Pilatotrama ljubarskyi]
MASTSTNITTATMPVSICLDRYPLRAQQPLGATRPHPRPPPSRCECPVGLSCPGPFLVLQWSRPAMHISLAGRTLSFVSLKTPAGSQATPRYIVCERTTTLGFVFVSRGGVRRYVT